LTSVDQDILTSADLKYTCLYRQCVFPRYMQIRWNRYVFADADESSYFIFKNNMFR
jgi:hypothetical protein